ncbi:hypothetical protein C2S52_006502 [Perilla frutescens var. hirtella]|nr:hypothetical protein C2S52_006502 [Perilla frutescens var. hirtella]
MNNISLVVRDDGTHVEDPDQICQDFVEYYSNLFGVRVASLSPVNAILDLGLKLDEDQRNALEADITTIEIKSALFDIGDEKAPGPDGYTSAFFKATWDITGPTLCNAVKEFFRSGKLLKQINHTIITLIPKVQHNPSVADFRPIACCNVTYKLISKIISNKLTKIVLMIICHAQSTFILGHELMFFARGDLLSVQIIIDTLKEFEHTYGLQINKHKSAFFTAGIAGYELEEIQSVVGFPFGTWPVRYLGVPLSPKKLGVINYDPLIEKIGDCINAWSAKTLSYVGLMELVKSVLQGFACYWIQVFPLPEHYISRITRLCREFLWDSKVSPVVWADICKPKEEG